MSCARLGRRSPGWGACGTEPAVTACLHLCLAFSSRRSWGRGFHLHAPGEDLECGFGSAVPAFVKGNRGRERGIRSIFLKRWEKLTEERLPHGGRDRGSVGMWFLLSASCRWRASHKGNCFEPKLDSQKPRFHLRGRTGVTEVFTLNSQSGGHLSGIYFFCFVFVNLSP